MPVMRAEGRADFIRLDPGKNYYWKVEEAESAYQAKTGNDQIKLILKVGDKSGQVKMFETLTFSDNAYFRIEQFLKSAGKYPGDGVDIYFDENDVSGLTGFCTIKYEHNEQKNRDYARIDRWLEADKQVPNKAWIEQAAMNSKPAEPSNDSWDPSDIPF